MAGGVFLLLGTNLGDRSENLQEALRRIGSVIKTSSVYVTAAWGKEDQPDFYNQVIEIDTALSPQDLLSKILAIEASMGRRRIEKWGTRLIDIDILFYKDVILESKDLTIPHPEIPNRNFTLIPLRELTNMKHPVLDKTIDQLIQECKDPLEVRRLQPQH